MKAACHCGTVELDINLANNLTDISRCNCSFCNRCAVAVVAVFLEDLNIVYGEGQLTMYQWGSKSENHYFCKTCGLKRHHQRRLNPNEMAVNLATIGGLHLQDFENIPWVEGIDRPSDMRS